MAKFIVKHRGGTTARWQASDVVLSDREIAIEKMPDGKICLLVGDGVHTYSDLSPVYCSVDNISNAQIDSLFAEEEDEEP